MDQAGLQRWLVSMKKVIGIDIGGTMIKSVLINESGEILFSKILPTNDSDLFAEWKELVRKVVNEIRGVSNDGSCLIGIVSGGGSRAAYLFVIIEQRSIIAQLLQVDDGVRSGGANPLECVREWGVKSYVCEVAHSVLKL